MILTPFPFTDLSSQKTRPAVVLSTKTLHNDDIIIGAISSKQGDDDIVLFADDFELGNLPKISYFKKGKLTTIQKSLVQLVIGKLNEEKKEKILEATRGLF